MVLLLPIYLVIGSGESAEKYNDVSYSITLEKVSQIFRSAVIITSGEECGQIINRVSLGVNKADNLIDTPEALAATSTVWTAVPWLITWRH